MNENQIHPDDELVVSYLDGELDSEQIGEFEKRLSAEPELCERLRQQQQAWDLLEQLPSRELDCSFTRSTIEMVVKKEQNSQTSVRNRWRWPLSIAAACLLLVGGLAVGVFSVRNYQLTILDIGHQQVFEVCPGSGQQ